MTAVWPELRADQQPILDRVTATAHVAALELVATRRLAVAVTLTPGDMTAYELLVVAPGVPRVGDSYAPDSTWWSVAVAVGSRSAATSWDGQPIDMWSAIDRWSPGEKWTGLIIAQFLTAFSERIAELEAQEAVR